MKKSVRNSIVGIVIFVIVLVFFAMRPQGGASQTFITEEVTQGNIELTVASSGKVVAVKSQNVVSRIGAKVTDVLVSTGDEVEAGTILAYLDKSDLEAAYKNAQYSFSSAIYRRNQLKVAPVYDDYAVKQAQQQVNQAQVALDTAKRNLENDKLIAPFKGQVTAVNIKVGDIAPVATPSFSLQTVDQVEGTLLVNEVDVNKIKVGQKLEAEIDAIQGVKSAEIYSIVNTAEVVNGVVTYLTKIRFADTNDLRPGMSLNAEIVVDRKENVVLVPSGALIESNGVTKVRLISGKDSQGKEILEDREVKIGLNNNSVAEVIEGLQNGDKVAITLQSNTSGSGIFGN